MPSLFSAPLIVESPLAPETVRERIRELVATRLLIGTSAFRWRQVLGWKLAERADEFTLEPSYARSRNAARLIGRIDAAGGGSRIVGRVSHPWFTRIVMSSFIIFVAIAAVAGLAQHNDPAFKVLWISAAMIGGCVLLVRFELRSTGALIEAGLRSAVAAKATTVSAG